jgi:hypothetical protein
MNPLLHAELNIARSALHNALQRVARIEEETIVCDPRARQAETSTGARQ